MTQPDPSAQDTAPTDAGAGAVSDVPAPEEPADSTGEPGEADREPG